MLQRGLTKHPRANARIFVAGVSYHWLSAIIGWVVIMPTLVFGFPQQRTATSSWTPPVSRSNVKTPFEPRPLSGQNIFKNEAEQWLADAVAKLELNYHKPISDTVICAYVSQLGKYIATYSNAPTKAYEFIITDDEEANAMTAGGGRIYINIGMLRRVESEDELACIIAHEVAHNAFAHAAKTATRQLFWMKGIRKIRTSEEAESALVALFKEYDRKPLAAIGENLLGFARLDELEADRAAFYTAYKAGYNPDAMSTVLKRMEHETKAEIGKKYDTYQVLNLLFGSHPLTSQRTMAVSWESNFVKMPPKEERHNSPAFNAIKTRVAGF